MKGVSEGARNRHSGNTPCNPLDASFPPRIGGDQIPLIRGIYRDEAATGQFRKIPGFTGMYGSPTGTG